jgi:hypothetical protein
MGLVEEVVAGTVEPVVEKVTLAQWDLWWKT